MKINGLHFLKFGHFTDFNLLFQGSTPGLHVIYGANEAGKTTMLRGIHRFFSGFPAQDPASSFLHPQTSLRVGADLTGEPGDVTFFRRKGNKNTLLDTDHKSVEESFLLSYLGGLSPSVYVDKFTLDHDKLRAGGEDLKKGKGDVAESLFSAGLGTPALRKLIQTLDAERNALFKPRGSKQSINVGLKRFKALNQDIKRRTVKPKDIDALEKDVSGLERVLVEHQKDLKTHETRKVRIGRLLQLLPALARLQDLEVKRHDLGGVPDLPQDCRPRRVAAQSSRLEMSQKIIVETKRLEECRSHLASQEEDPGLLKVGATLKSLEGDLARLKGRRQQRGSFEAKIEQIMSAIADQAEHLLPNMSIEGVLSLYPGRPNAQYIRELGGHKEALSERLREAEQRLQTDRRSLEEQEKILLELPVSASDPGSLKAVLKEYRSLEGRHELLEGELAQLAEQERSLGSGLLQLSFKGQGLDCFLALIWPEEEECRHLAAQLESIEKDQADLARQQGEMEKSLLDVEAEERSLQVGGTLPKEGDLSGSREERDGIFQTLHDTWSQGIAYNDTTPGLGNGKSRVLAYSQAVVHADNIADTLRDESDRVAQIAQLQGRLAGLRHQLSGLLQHCKTIDAKHLNTLDEWASIFEPLALSAPTHRGLPSWLSQVQSLRQKGETFIAERHRMGLLAKQIDEAKTVLSDVLFQFSGKHPSSLPLGALLQEAEDRLKAFEEERYGRDKILGEVSRQRLDVERSEGALNKAKMDLGVWTQQWAGHVTSLKLGEKSTPLVVLSTLTLLEGILAEHQKAHGMTREITEINTEEEVFRRELRAFLAVYTPENIDLSMEMAVANLRKRYDVLDRAHSRRTDLLKDEAERVERLLEFGSQLSTAKTTLSELVAIAGVDEAQMPELETRCIAATELDGRINGERSGVLTLGGGLSLDEISAEVAGVDVDALEPELNELDVQILSLRDMEATARESLGAKRRDLEELVGGEGAILAAEEQAEVAGHIRSLSERYVSLTVAKTLIRHEIERYRVENEKPVLRKAQEFFRDLTLGSFQTLAVEYGQRDRAVLLGVRSSGEQVGVEGMSDGTQDQLYLALRLATLQVQSQGAETLPIVVDDILINADDARAKAGLSLLAGFAQHTQVLFFTHHRRMVELAGSLDEAGGVHIYEI